MSDTQEAAGWAIIRQGDVFEVHRTEDGTRIRAKWLNAGTMTGTVFTVEPLFRASSGERQRDSDRLEWLEANRDDLVIQQQVDPRSDGMPWRIYDCRRHCSEYGRTLVEAIDAARAARSTGASQE